MSVLSKGLLFHLWSVSGCTLPSKAVTGKTEVLSIDCVRKCALVLKILREILSTVYIHGALSSESNRGVVENLHVV
jgi:hypothetical protein